MNDDAFNASKAANPHKARHGSPNSVTVRVPATTANLGPGFDTLGIALALYNEVRVTRLHRANARGCHITSAINEADRSGATAMLTEAAKLFFRRARCPSFGIEIHLSGEVPIARGLGSSVTARLGVIAGLNELLQTGLDRQEMLLMVTQLEHHPDNAAPAILGGFTAAGMVGRSVRFQRFPVHERAKFVTLIPRFEVSTEKARQLVPDSFSKADTVHNLNRAALITAAFAQGDYEALRGLFDDRVHQPYREQLLPQLSKVIRAGERSGAIGGWLSGSGSTIICLTFENADRVARYMQRQLPDSDIKILRADNDGFSVL